MKVWKLTGKSFEYLRGPCVYIWHSDDKVLYVGSSAVGLSRIFDRSHHILGRRSVEDHYDLINDTDEIEIIFTESRESAYQLEKTLIRSLKPEYNLQLYEN